MTKLSEIVALPKSEQDAFIAKLRAVFNQVKPDGNWKGAIYRTVRVSPEQPAELFVDAIEWFTGSAVTVRVIDAETVVLDAAGYYAACGA